MSVNVDVGTGDGLDEVAALRRERDRYAALCAALRAEQAAQDELVSLLEEEAARLSEPREATTSIDAGPTSLRVDGAAAFGGKSVSVGIGCLLGVVAADSGVRGVRDASMLRQGRVGVPQPVRARVGPVNSCPQQCRP